jgi:hypothetical protein
MLFKFSWNCFRTEYGLIGLRLPLILFFSLSASVVKAQTLDWWNDMTVFGTTADERRPVVIMSPSGSRLRLLCVCNDSCISSKTSGDNGESWSASSDSVFSAAGLQIAGTADEEYHYLMVGAGASSLKTLFRWEQTMNDFRSALAVPLASSHTGQVHGFDIKTNAAYRPGNPYLNVVWIEEVSPGIRALYFTQSQNRAVDFLPETEITRFAATSVADSSAAVCSAWQANSEYVLSAIAVDRSGSAPEEIRVFRSTDQGSSWTAVEGIDATTSSQTQPTLAAFGATVLLAYTYGALPSARNIRFSFSLDGGVTFSAPQVIAGSSDDEHSPRLLIDDSGQTFSLVFLAGNPDTDSATVLVCTGLVAAPWQGGVSVAVSEPGTAVADGGLSAAVGERGAAAAWTSRFVSGDLDVRFDAAWRGSSARERIAELPVYAELAGVYPNPFNSSTNMQLTLMHSSPVILTTSDILGRVVRRSDLGILPAGECVIPLDFAGLSTGMYFIRLENSAIPAQRVLLLR